jgi:hypothetical protein
MFEGLAAISGELVIALTDRIAATLRLRKGFRNYALIILGFLFVAALIIAIDPPLFRLPITARGPAIGAAVVLFYLVASVLLAYTDLKLANVTDNLQRRSISHVLGDQLFELGEERKVLEQRLTDRSPSESGASPEKEELFDASLELNLNQLREYYVINKSQARSSFRMGVASVLLGLSAILVGVGLVYAGGGGKTHIGVAVVTAVAGLLAQFIGASCFYLFNKAQEQSIHYYDRLTELQGTLLAVQLAGSITKTDLADATRQEIVFALVKWTPEARLPGRRNGTRPRSTTGGRRRNQEVTDPTSISDAHDTSV